MNTIYFYLFLALFLFFKPATLSAQDSTQTITVFLDCRQACDESYVRNEIKFVNYVRNKEEADVHLMIIGQRTSSGGEEFILQLIGGNQFLGVDKTLTYYSAESDTRNEQRIGLNNYIRRGLFPYLAEQPIAEQLIINYETEDDSQSGPKLDKWDYWLFDISADTDIEGEESEKEFSLQGRISVERITLDGKFEFDVEQYYERQTFSDDGTERTFTKESRGATCSLLKA